MITSNIGLLKKICTQANIEGKTMSILGKMGSNRYEVNEYTALVKSIEPYPEKPEMRRVTLAFKNIDLETVVYLDSDIVENTVVTVVGFCYEYNNKPTFACKGGISRIYTTLEEISTVSKIYRNKTYRMGFITGLSTIIPQEPFYTRDENIFKLGDSNLEYAIEEKNSRDISQIIFSRQNASSNELDINSLPMEDNSAQNTSEIIESPIVEETKRTNNHDSRIYDEFGNFRQVSL